MVSDHHQATDGRSGQDRFWDAIEAVPWWGKFGAFGAFVGELAYGASAAADEFGDNVLVGVGLALAWPAVGAVVAIVVIGIPYWFLRWLEHITE